MCNIFVTQTESIRKLLMVRLRASLDYLLVNWLKDILLVQKPNIFLLAKSDRKCIYVKAFLFYQI